MHIGFNILNQVPRAAGGIETYARELIAAMAELRPDLRLTAFMNSEMYDYRNKQPWPGGVNARRIAVRGSNRVRRVLAEQVLMPLYARRSGVDLLHSLGTTGPLWAGVPHILTLHDVNWVFHPDTLGRASTFGLNVLVPRVARNATRIITDTESAKRDFVSVLNFDPAKVDVVYMGHGQSVGERVTDEGELRKKLHLGAGPIVLFVSGKRPHKNLLRLIDAFHKLEHDPEPVLVLPGPGEEGYERALCERAAELGIEGRVKLLGWLDEPDLEGLYKAARCFVFPSLREGFGLPVLEAMKRGVPVALSSAQPLPEIAGDAARYFDPENVNDMAAAISELIGDEQERERLIDAGLQRAAQFTWEAAAERTADIYEHILQGSKPRA